MPLTRAETVDLYQRFLACCNERRYDDLGDLVDAEISGLGQGTHTGPFEGIAPTGRAVSVQELVVYRIVDGRIAGCWGDLHPVVRDALTTGGGALR